MRRLQPPDTHYLSAAIGWLELGLPREARAELNHLSPENRDHPDVLEVRWLIHAHEQEWPEAVTVARQYIAASPERSFGWVNQAYALRRAADGGLEKAWKALHPAAALFPEEPQIAFNLSCYACQLQRLDEARRWLRRAFAVAGRKDALKRMALKEEDLRPLWDEIKTL